MTNDLSALALPEKLHSNHKDDSWLIILYTTFSKLFKCQNESALSVLSIALSQVVLTHSSLEEILQLESNPVTQ